MSESSTMATWTSGAILTHELPWVPVAGHVTIARRLPLARAGTKVRRGIASAHRAHVQNVSTFSSLGYGE